MSFGHSSRDDLKLQVNPLKVYMTKDYTKEGGENTGDLSHTSAFARAMSPPTTPGRSTFGASSREDIHKQMNMLRIARPADHSSYPVGPALKTVIPGSPATKFGKSLRSDLEKRANELRVYQSKDYSAVGDSINYDNLTTEMNARFRTPGRVCIGKAPRHDFQKMVNPLGVPLPKDLSTYRESKDAKAVYDFDSRNRTPSSFKFSKSSRSDLEKRANELRVYQSKDYSAVGDSINYDNLTTEMNARFRTPGRVCIGKAPRHDIEKMANTLAVPMVSTTTRTVDYTDPNVNDFDSRFKTKGSAHFLHAERDAFLKQNNVLGSSLPRDYTRMGVSDSVDTARLCKAIDQRYTNQPRVPMASSQRQDLYRQANPLGAVLPKDLSEQSGQANSADIMTTVNSKFRNPPSTKFGREKREAKKYLANPLGCYMPKDYSHMQDTTNPDKVVSPMDSRFRTAPKVSIGSSTREAYSKQSNLFGVVEMLSDCEGTYDVDRYHSISAIAHKKRKQKTKGFGTSNREDLEKLNNPQNVPMPYSYTATVPYVEHPISKSDSRFKRAASAGFGFGNREDVILQANPLGATMPPRSTVTGKRPPTRRRRDSPSSPRRPPTRRRSTSMTGPPKGPSYSGRKPTSPQTKQKMSKSTNINPKQKMLMEIRQENAKYKRQASKKQWAIILKARKNGSQWIKYFQNQNQREL